VCPFPLSSARYALLFFVLNSAPRAPLVYTTACLD
jgi:hypothetical protein